MGCPHRSHTPYRPSASRRSAASHAATCSRAAASRAAACCRSNASVAPSGSCSSSVPAALAASASPANSRSSAATRSRARRPSSSSRSRTMSPPPCHTHRASSVGAQSGRTNPGLALLPGSRPPGVPPGAARSGGLGARRRDERGGDRLAGAEAGPAGQPRAVGRRRRGRLHAAGSGRRDRAAALAARPPGHRPGDRERGPARHRPRPGRLPGAGRSARAGRLRRPARRLVTADRVGRGGQVHADRGPVPGRPAGRREHGVQPGRPAQPDDRPGPGRGDSRPGRPGHRHRPGRGELGPPRRQLRRRRPLPARCPHGTTPARRPVRGTAPARYPTGSHFRTFPLAARRLGPDQVGSRAGRPARPDIRLLLALRPARGGPARARGPRPARIGGAARPVLGGVRRGAIGGELSAPYLRRWPVWPVMTGIVLAWGLALLPLGLPAPRWAGLAAFFAGGLIFGPWMSLSMGVFQDASPSGTLAQVLAARSSLLILAGPIGTAFGGPLVAALGARGTLLASALATIALGLVTTAVLARARTRTRAQARAGARARA